MYSADLLTQFLDMERKDNRPEAIEYSGRDRIFLWRFPSGLKTLEDVADDEPAEILRAITQLNDYLRSHELQTVGFTRLG